MSSRVLASVLATAAMSLLAACEHLPQSISSVAASPDKPIMQSAGELPPPPRHSWQDINEDLNNHRADGWGLVSMPEMEQYLNGLLYKIKVATGTTDWPGAVRVTADTSLNASSSAAGNIYIPIGWLQSAESEDEIFAILSHEYGHIYLNHYAVYDVKNAGDASAIIAGAAWSYVNRNISDHGWNGIDKIAVVQTLGTTVLTPAWQRHIEEQADLFGATVSLRCGYSYIHGFKAFLERIDSYDESVRTRDAKIREAQDTAVHIRIRNDAKVSIANAPAPQPVASDAAAPLQALAAINQGLHRLNVAMVDGQASVKERAFDATSALDHAIADGAAAVRDTHPEGAERENDLSKSIKLLLPQKRPAARMAAWETAKSQPRTKATLSHYALVPQIELLEAQRHYPEALKLAQIAASGPNQNDAMPDFYLGNLMALMHTQGKETAAQVFMRNVNSKERSWRLQMQLAHALIPVDRPLAQTYVEQQFVYFGRAPKTWPDVIAFYRDSGDIKRAKDMAMTCSIKAPDYRQACITMSQTPAELAEIKAKTDAHAKLVSDNLAKRWFKQ